MQLSDKIRIYQKLLAGLSKGVTLAATLAEQGRDAEVAEVDARNRDLANAAADLRLSITKDWNGAADAVMDDLRASSERLQDQLREIQRSVDSAERVVRAIGYLDELIRTGVRLVA